jgi:hypothetical protein
MHGKKSNNNKSGNFIQGLRPFANSIPQGLKKILKKGGYNFSNIVDNWSKMVGREISGSCYPSSVKTSNEVNGGKLILNVLHGKELEIEYSKKEIIDKVNSFFGYNYIDQIKLKIVQEKKESKPTKIYKNSFEKKFKVKMDVIQNKDLKNSLNKLLKAFNEKNN